MICCQLYLSISTTVHKYSLKNVFKVVTTYSGNLFSGDHFFRSPVLSVLFHEIFSDDQFSGDHFSSDHFSGDHFFGD